MTRVYIPDIEASERMGVAGFLTQRSGLDVRLGASFSASAREVVAGIGDAEVVCVALGRVAAEAMDAAAGLRLVVKCGIGVDNIDVDAARERGIGVVRTAGVNTRGPAEWVIGAAIAHLRQFGALDRRMRAGEWGELRTNRSGLVPALTGRTLGIAGLGSIGRQLAALGSAHGMDVIAHDPYLDAAADTAGARLVDRDTLLRCADVLSLNMVLTEETRHWLSSDAIALMKPTALLANCSRGPVVDEAALVHALREERIAGAVLDVFELEPPDAANPLFALDRVLLTPHLGGCTDHGYQEIGALTAELVERFSRGEEIPRPCVVVGSADLVVAGAAAAAAPDRV